MPALRLLIAVAALVFGAAVAHGQTPVPSEQRVALVIGNSAYQTAPLYNPGFDAEDMSKALQELGFKVIVRRNVDRNAMRAAIREFGEELKRAQAGLFYFSGHGVQLKGNNYLIPVREDIRTEADAEDLAVPAAYVLGVMEDSGARTKIVILDACRDNPYMRSFRSAGRGLAQMSPGAGTLVAFSTSAGSVADDGTGRNGLYTRHLLESLRQPDSEVLRVFQRTRAGVVNESKGRQTPVEFNTLVADFRFREVTVSEPAPVAPSDRGADGRALSQAVKPVAPAPTPEIAAVAPVTRPATPPAARDRLPALNAVGNYRGNYLGTSGRGEQVQGITLEITSIDGENVKGKAVRMEIPLPGWPATCNGNYNLQGTLKGNALALHSIESGRVQGCNLTLQLTLEGRKLTGTVDGYKAELSK
jgi:predicted anti-sigma-YlaC factor YlaD